MTREVYFMVGEKNWEAQRKNCPELNKTHFW